MGRKSGKEKQHLRQHLGDPSPAARCLAPCKPMSLGGGDNSPPEQPLHGSEMHKGNPEQKPLTGQQKKTGGEQLIRKKSH